MSNSNFDFKHINWTPLVDEISTLLNLTKEQLGLHINVDGRRPELESNNIQPFCGPFAATCSTVNVQFFNFWPPSEEYPTLGGTVTLAYQSWEHGSIGMTFLTFWYDISNGWRFQVAPKAVQRY